MAEKFAPPTVGHHPLAQTVSDFERSLACEIILALRLDQGPKWPQLYSRRTDLVCYKRSGHPLNGNFLPVRRVFKGRRGDRGALPRRQA